MKSNPIFYTIVTFVVIVTMTSCKKQDGFLNQKPSASLATISSLSDCQLLLQNENVFNGNDPGLGEISSDDFYLPTSTFVTQISVAQNSYIWAKSIFPAGAVSNDYSDSYNQVYYANTVLDALPNIPVSSSQQALANTIKGTALFYRSYAFYNLIQTWAMPYDSTSASTQLGIPLRLSSDVNIKSTRASEKDCYNQISSDLQLAISLLPTTTPYPTQPSQTAAYGLLARVYLATGNYSNAFKFSNAALTQNNNLVDYNKISPGPFSLITTGYLVEDIFHSTFLGYTPLFTVDVSITDSTLYKSYNNANDLRKSLFFVTVGGLPEFRGSYDQKTNTYSGIAVDEMYLIRAECYARAGNTSLAMNDLNTLLVTRWKTGTYIPFSAPDANTALKMILQERRKELIFRGTRWTDLRRLNKDPQFAITLTRVINGTTYTLPPNDPRYAFPFDDREIQLTGIPQNQR